MTQYPRISNSNSKLGQFVYHFSISVKSCAYATPHCDKYCYAKRGKMNVHQNSTYANNYEASKQDNFVEKMINLIYPLSMDLKYFRIHTSGDFYSQKYFDKWVQIASNFPQMKFLAYTRNHMIDTNQRPSNLQLLFSCDESTKRLNPTIPRVARVIYNPKEEVKHLGVALDGVYCDSKCVSCRYCWDDPPNNINFALRGIKGETLIRLTTIGGE